MFTSKNYVSSYQEEDTLQIGKPHIHTSQRFDSLCSSGGGASVINDSEVRRGWASPQKVRWNVTFSGFHSHSLLWKVWNVPDLLSWNGMMPVGIIWGKRRERGERGKLGWEALFAESESLCYQCVACDGWTWNDNFNPTKIILQETGFSQAHPRCAIN